MSPPFQPAAGRFGSIVVDEPLPREFTRPRVIGALAQRVSVGGGCHAYVRGDETVDAIEVTAGYSHRILDCFSLGDPVAALFADDRTTPRFAAEFVEFADSALYFRFSSGMALTVRVEGIEVEDGPFSDEEWRVVLRGRVGSAAVSRHGDKLYAY